MQQPQKERWSLELKPVKFFIFIHMKHLVPLFLSLFFSIAGTVLIMVELSVIGQSALVLAFITGMGAFKMRGVLLSVVVHALPAFILASFYFTAAAFPFLSLALIIVAFQNPFVDIIFPGKMYSNTMLKQLLGLTAISCYIVGNIVYPLGWQAWLFPGILVLLAAMFTVLTVKGVMDMNKVVSKVSMLDAGKSCPDFTLKDESGTPVSSSDFRGRFLLLIFVRGDWCPGCHIMLRAYQRNKERLLERDVHLLSIGPDPHGVNKDMVTKLGLTYHVLSDENQRVAQQFCVELQDQQPGVADQDFVPLPASFLIDKEGFVRYTSRADVAGEILYPDRIFEVLDALA
jgi:peroxiredoxin